MRTLKLTAFIAVLVFIIGGLSWLSKLQALALTDVSVVGNASIDASDIEKIAKQHLAGSYMALFPRSNKMLYPKDAIEQDIKKEFPGISSLNVDSKGHALRVTIKERKSAYVWCKGTPSDKDTDGCYFMDDTGYIFIDAPKLFGNAYLVYYGQIKSENPIGQTFLTPDELASINTLRETLDHKDVSSTAVYAKDEGVRELYLTQGGKIIFKSSQESENLASSIELVKLNTQLLDKDSSAKLNYIDLRFGNKVYYKTYGDNPVQSEI